MNIYVRNAEQSQKWYEDVLGLHTYSFTPGRAAFMTANLDESHEIALMEVGANAPGPEQGRVGSSPVPGINSLRSSRPSPASSPFLQDLSKPRGRRGYKCPVPLLSQSSHFLGLTSQQTSEEMSF